MLELSGDVAAARRWLGEALELFERKGDVVSAAHTRDRLSSLEAGPARSAIAGVLRSLGDRGEIAVLVEVDVHQAGRGVLAARARDLLGRPVVLEVEHHVAALGDAVLKRRSVVVDLDHHLAQQGEQARYGSRAPSPRSGT